MTKQTDILSAPPSATDDRKGVQSVDRAFDLLRVFERSGRPLGVKDIADVTAMTPSQVHHYLVSLTRAKAISQRPDGLYELGAFSLQLGLTALRRLDPIQRAVDAAKAFRDATGEVTIISVWGTHGPTVVRQFEGVQSVCIDVRVGQTLPLIGSATGHVFLSWLSAQATQPFIAADKKPSVAAVQTATHKAGLGHVQGAMSSLVASLAAPAFDSEGQLAFCLTTLGWVDKFDGALDGATAVHLKKSAAALSAALGHVDA